MADNKRNITGSYPGAEGAKRPKKKINPAGSYPGAKPKEPDFKIAASGTAKAEQTEAPVKKQAPTPKEAPVKKEPTKKAPVKKAKAPKDKKKLFTADFFKKYGRSMAYYAAILLVSIFLACWVCSIGNEVLGLVREDKEVTVTIEKKSTPAEVGEILKKEGVIDHPKVFELYCKLKKQGKFMNGEFVVNIRYDYNQLIKTLKADSKEKQEVSFTIEPGYTQEDFVEVVCDSLKYLEREELEEVLQKYDFSDDFSWLGNLPDRGYRLEGYLLPGTYKMKEGESAYAIVYRILSQFEEKVLTDKNLKKIEKSGYTLDELVTVASILQKEGGEDMKKGAGVYFNRLKDKKYSYLDSQATIAYFLSADHGAVTKDDLKIKDPYNTYRNTGLPEGPISNPSAAVLEAVFNPTETSNFYFVTREDGKMLFSTTAEAHSANIKKAGSNLRGTGTIG